MKKKSGYILRDICGEHLLVPRGEENIDLSNMISMNDSAAYLWQSTGDEDFDEDKLVGLLTDEYEVEEDVARADIKQLVAQWQEAGIIDA